MRVRAVGLDEVIHDLELLDARLNREPLTPLLEILGQDWASAAQENIRNGAIDLPEHHPATVKIREHYGHGGKGKLIRGGDLIQSIATLEFDESHVVVGTELEFARVLHDGGEVADRRGGTHTVPPWPFLPITEQMADDAAALVLDYFTGGEGGEVTPRG